MNKVRVLLADDHGLVRDGIRTVLGKATDMQMVGEAVDGEEALTKARELSPDVVITDITMPRMNGIELVATLKKEKPSMKVIMLSMHENEEYVTHAIESGADGYVTKNTEQDELLYAIRAVAGGEKYYSNNISRMMIDSYVRKSKGNDKEPRKSSVYLTRREKDILRLVIEGLNSKQIADKLFLSPRTVETHRTNMIHKMGVKNSSELVRLAFQQKLLED